MSESMKERPILFGAEMVRAILEGRKTQTRRVAWCFDIHQKMRKLEPDIPIQWAAAVHPARESGWVSWFPANSKGLAEFTKKQYRQGFQCPYGQIGDILWVRESISKPMELDITAKFFTGFYRATEPERKVEWVPSIHMPRWASRIKLEIIGVRVERLQDISEEDAKAEGITAPAGEYYAGIAGDRMTVALPDDPSLIAEGEWRNRFGYRVLWEKINGARASWSSNPWVWVVEFKRL